MAVDAGSNTPVTLTVDDHDQLETEVEDRQPDAQTDDDDGEEDNSSQSNLPFPLFASKAFYLLDQNTVPRKWCLQLITSPYPFLRLFTR